MSQTYRVTVPAKNGGAAAEIRLGSYVSDDQALPPTAPTDASAKDGILLTTTGSLAFAAEGTGTFQSNGSVSIGLAEGDFALTASELVTLTANSIYIQGGTTSYPLEASNGGAANGPSVPAGQIQITSGNEFLATSDTSNITLTCPAEGYKKHISTGFEEIWGNQTKGVGTGSSVTLAAATDVASVVYPSWDTLRLKLRFNESKMAVNASGAAAFKSSAYITKLENKSLGNTLALMTGLKALYHGATAATSAIAKAAKSKKSGADVGTGGVDAEQMGAQNQMNATGELNV